MRQFCLLSYEDPEGLIPLFDEKISGGNPNVTVIIGPNGSGKSRILSKIVEELWFVDGIRKGDITPLTRIRLHTPLATLRYRMNGKECKIVRRGVHTVCTVGDKRINLEKMPFPKRVAAVSHLPSDRFRFLRGGEDGFYRYLGLRQSTNLTTTGALETKVLQSLLSGFVQPGFIQRFESWLTLAGISKNISLDLVLATRKLLAEDYNEFRDAIIEIFHRRAAMRGRSVENPDEDVIKIWRFFTALRKLNWGEDGSRPSCAYELKYLLSEPEDAAAWIEGFDIARRWRLFASTTLLLGKRGGSFPFSDLSSGEQQLIGTNARLLAELDSDSLVVIDEPEVSLHPEWQIKYIPTLRDCLSAMSAMHIIIATHSHFMVSDLDDNNSSLITSDDNVNAKFELFDGAVFGRSPENILYRVFGVATTGNTYVENDLHRALRMLSNAVPIDLDELAAIYARLEKVRGRDNMAMNIILEQVGEFIEAKA